MKKAFIGAVFAISTIVLMGQAQAGYTINRIGDFTFINSSDYTVPSMTCVHIGTYTTCN